jgi:uncharacterized membrane-anchored protein YitT (DUF2179 family)
MKESNKFMGWAVIILGAAILAISFYTFLFTKETYEGAITGLQALQQQTTEFWIWAIILSALSGVGVFFIAKKVKSLGGHGVPLSVFIPIIIFLTIAWGKGCTDKQNDGVTAGKGRPVPAKIDSTRIPAEDLLPK